MARFVEIEKEVWVHQDNIRRFYMEEKSLLLDMGSEIIRIDEPDEIKRVLGELLDKE